MISGKDKIIKLDALVERISTLKKNGKNIAFTNGCFDILHFGHVSYLEKAKNNNRILIVGLNSDSSVRKLKGDQRPIVPQKERAGVLAALECVDFVVLFSDETPMKLISAIKPDILIKGADWKGKGIVGEDIVRSIGGKIEFIKFEKGCSTTNIIKAVLDKCQK